jgi:6,7-dimethyl-8-ribityllumazine synthase
MTETFQPHEVRGAHDLAGLHFGVAVSRFNGFITDRLLAAALDALERGGVTSEQIEVARVPGSFELPLAAKKMAGACDAVIAIGCILRGETAHFDYIAAEVSRGIQLAQLDSGVPIIFCVLTCDTLEQAINRAGLKGGNKGFEAGVAAIEMATLCKALTKAPSRAPAKTPVKIHGFRVARAPRGRKAR